jgi:hypothetical protein
MINETMPTRERVVAVLTRDGKKTVIDTGRRSWFTSLIKILKRLARRLRSGIVGTFSLYSSGRTDGRRSTGPT